MREFWVRAKGECHTFLLTYVPLVGSVLTSSEATICYPNPPEENIIENTADEI